MKPMTNLEEIIADVVAGDLEPLEYSRGILTGLNLPH